MFKQLRFFFEFPICALGGMEGILLSAALSGAGMIMNQRAADEAADKQRKIMLRAEEEEKKLANQKRNETLNFTNETFDPAQRDARYEQEATKNESSLIDGLLKANGGTEGEVKAGAEGNLSADYLRSRASNTAAAATNVRKRAKLMARSNAGNLMYGNEALKMGELNSNLGAYDAQGRSVRRVADARLSRAQNKGSLVGGLMQAFAPAAGSALNGHMNAGSLASEAFYNPYQPGVMG